MFVDVGLPTLLNAAPPDPDAPPQNPDDGYPDVMRDARHIYGVETVDDLVTFWSEWCDQHGLTQTWDDRPVVPYVNRGRWQADCPACGAHQAAWDRIPRLCCLDCGTVAKVAWQPPAVRAHAVRLLAVRDLVNQNWNAHQGETVDELDRENRWLLNEPAVVRNGLVVPVGLSVPDALKMYREL